MRSFHLLMAFGLMFLDGCDKGLLSPLPEIETLPAIVGGPFTFTLEGNIMYEGKSSVVSRGFYWSHHPNPTDQDSSSTNGSGLYAFSQAIRVWPDSIYYYRTYGTNSAGTVLGQEMSFRTPKSGTFTDPRDSRKYAWVNIGTQTWMAENLAYLPRVSRSDVGSLTERLYYVTGYEGTYLLSAKSTPEFKAYGALYNWMAALDACPAGWHLPADSEWLTLEQYLGMAGSTDHGFFGNSSGAIGTQLKEAGTEHWVSPGATNSSAFSARGGGMRYNGSGFSLLKGMAHFWTASDTTAAFGKMIWCRSLISLNEGISALTEDPVSGLSVRCIKD